MKRARKRVEKKRLHQKALTIHQFFHRQRTSIYDSSRLWREVQTRVCKWRLNPRICIKTLTAHELLKVFSIQIRLIYVWSSRRSQWAISIENLHFSITLHLATLKVSSLTSTNCCFKTTIGEKPNFSLSANI